MKKWIECIAFLGCAGSFSRVIIFSVNNPKFTNMQVAIERQRYYVAGLVFLFVALIAGRNNG